MGRTPKKPNFFNAEIKFKFWETLIDQKDYYNNTCTLFNKLKPFEERLGKDVLDFTQDELTETFFGLTLYTCRERKDNLILLNKYALYMGKPELTLPGEADLKKLYVERGKFEVVFNDEDLFDAMMVALDETNCVDKHYYDMPILRQLMLYYGVSDEQLVNMKKTFINDFKLPTGKEITSKAIQNFIINVVMSGGYRVGGKDGTVRYRRYVETELLLARSYYVSDTPKRTDKPQENLLNQLRTQFKELYSNDDRLTTKNITMAGKFDRAYQLDMSKGNKEIILSWYILGQKAHIKGLTLLEEERYNVYKLFRLNNNI